MAGFTNLPPQPPEDPDVRNIVDKLANFVARNGHEFEQMTMDKQRNNPKFAFLFGGEYHAYYKWKVAMEQGIFFTKTDHSHSVAVVSSAMGVHSQAQSVPKGQEMAEAPEAGGGAGQEGVGSSLLDRLVHIRQEQQRALEQQGMIDVHEEEFVKTVKPLMDSCTKDAIASGKSWILSHTSTPEECNKMAHFLMRRTLDSPVATFSQKLHIVYLINDLLFHCQRKGSADLQKAIEASIVQIFFNVRAGQSDDNKDKLAKVLNIWEGQGYFSPPVLEQIHEVLEKGGSVPDIKQEPPPSAPEPPPLIQGGDPPPLMATPLPLPPPWQGKGDSMWKPPPLMEKPPWGPPPEGAPWQPPTGEPLQPPPWHQPLPAPDPPAWMKNEQPENKQQQQPPPWQQRETSERSNLPPWQQGDNSERSNLPSWQQGDNSERSNLPPWQQGDNSERSNLPPWQQGDNSERSNLPPWQQGDNSERSNLPPWQQGDTSERSNLPSWQQGEPRLKPPPWHSSDPPPWQQGPPPRLPLPPWIDPRDGPPLHPPFEGFPPPPGPLPDWRDGSLPPFPPRGPPHGDPESFRGPPPHDHRGPPPHDHRGPPPHDHRGPPPHDHRGLPSHDHRGPPPHDHRGPPPHDHRGPPPSDHRGPHSNDHRGPPPQDHRGPLPHDHRGPPPHDYRGPSFHDRRGPSHDHRDRPPHDHRDSHDHRDPPPHDSRGPPHDQRDPPSHDHRGPPPRDQRDPPPHDHRVPSSVDEEPQMPSIPYFDLPAGLMVPLVPLEEHSYKPIDPMLVRLPRPQPPSKRLLEAVEEFYAEPSEDRPRNEDGWEAKALLTFFDKKLKAKQGRTSVSRQSRRRSPSPSGSRSKSRSRSSSRSRSRSESRSRSHSPQQRRSRSRSFSRSPSPQRRRSRSRSRSPFASTVPSRHSPSPERPMLGASAAERIPEGNVGHQMLRRMGWEGTGLGSSHQGIQEPVRGGDVRDRGDKYKGVGVDDSDSFSQFRKRKSYVYNRQPPPRLGQS